MGQGTTTRSTSARNRSVPLEPRVAVVTLGQTPRIDVVPELCEMAGRPMEAMEFGVLDGVDAETLGRIAPGPGETALITRLRDGSDIVMSIDWTSDRMQEIYSEIAGIDIDLVVLMSSLLGAVPAPARTTIFCDRVVSRTIETFADAGLKVGIVLSLDSQGDMVVRERTRQPDMVRAAIARPGDGAALAGAIDELAECDVLILHSVTYSEEERRKAATRSGKPVVLARRLVASAIREALDRLAAPRDPDTTDGALSERLRTLSVREREIMFLVAGGLANKEIAFRLGISFRTVEIHRARMMSKMEFRTMTDLVRTVDSLSEF
ncbi:MAG: AroM family protein [Alphaproteobacteria bacterium]|nr:AroM family protein [Alphaproteobacteria bacterium]